MTDRAIVGGRGRAGGGWPSPPARHPADLRPGPGGAVQLAGGPARPRGRAGAGPVRRQRRGRAGGAVARGAARSRFVESDRRACDVLRHNIDAVGLAGREVAPPAGRAVPRAGRAGRAVRLVFADPPYALGEEELGALLAALAAPRWLADGAVVVVERSARGREPQWPDTHRGGRAEALRRGRALVRSPAMSTPQNSALRTSSPVRRAVCPGSFDPVTNGHLDIIGRAAELYDEVVVAVFVNQSKSSLFTVEERRDMLAEVTADYPTSRSTHSKAWSWTTAATNDIPVIVKGLRAVSDFDYELQMAQMNRGLAGVDTLFMPTNPEYSFLASSLVKEIAKWGGDVSALVPPNVLKRAHRARPSRAGPPRRGDAMTDQSLRRTDELLTELVETGRDRPRRCPMSSSIVRAARTRAGPARRPARDNARRDAQTRAHRSASRDQMLHEAYERRATATREAATPRPRPWSPTPASSAADLLSHEAEQTHAHEIIDGRPSRARPPGLRHRRPPGRQPRPSGPAARRATLSRGTGSSAARRVRPPVRAEADRRPGGAQPRPSATPPSSPRDAEDYAERTLAELAGTLQRSAATAEQGRVRCLRRRRPRGPAQPGRPTGCRRRRLRPDRPVRLRPAPDRPLRPDFSCDRLSVT